MQSAHRQTHLIPMLRVSYEDSDIVFNVLKLLVKLTMKPEQLGECCLHALLYPPRQPLQVTQMR